MIYFSPFALNETHDFFFNFEGDIEVVPEDVHTYLLCLHLIFY